MNIPNEILSFRMWFSAVGDEHLVCHAAFPWSLTCRLPDGHPYPYHVPPTLPVLEEFVAQCKANGIGAQL